MIQTLRLAADNMPHKVLGLECYSIIAQIVTLEVIEFIVERFEDGSQGLIKYALIYGNSPLCNFLYNMFVIEACLYSISEASASLLCSRIRDYRSMSVLKLRTSIDRFAFTRLIRAKNYEALRYLIDHSEVPKLDHVDIDYLDEIQEHMLREYV